MKKNRGAAVMKNLFLLTILVACSAAGADTIDVVIDPGASELERFAASELCGYLEKLYGIRTRPVGAVSPDSRSVLLLGNPGTSPALKRLAGSRPLPRLSSQGILL